MKQVRLYHAAGDQASVVGGSDRKSNAVGSLLELRTFKSGNVETQKVTYTYDRGDPGIRIDFWMNHREMGELLRRACV